MGRSNEGTHTHTEEHGEGEHKHFSEERNGIRGRQGRGRMRCIGDTNDHEKGKEEHNEVIVPVKLCVDNWLLLHCPSSSSSSIFTNPNSTLVVVVKQYQQQQQLNNYHHNHHNHAAAAAVLLPFKNNNNLTELTTELAHATVRGGGDRHSDHFADGFDRGLKVQEWRFIKPFRTDRHQNKMAKQSQFQSDQAD
ncbi:hypothetical protein niasHT_032447 [Heterodera trifolii]|uniref:Uncharacterized protein n=1 Tax=Heterodera trifolii TaxID=157864 RepID=A0ABD2IMH8_9BILA